MPKHGAANKTIYSYILPLLVLEVTVGFPRI